MSAFNSRDKRFKDPFGAVAVLCELNYRLRVGHSEAAAQVRMLIQQDAPEEREPEPVAVPMQWDCLEGESDLFCCRFSPQQPGLYFYWFELETQAGIKYICNDQYGAGSPAAEKGCPFQQTVYDPEYRTPDWLKGGILYQIMPDRFCRAGGMLPDTTEGRTRIDAWGELPPIPEGNYPSDIYFGGNFRGIVEKLPYLKSLNVTALYLNPVFESHAYHRYNTADYRKIDPLLGSAEDFQILCEKAKAAGIRIILDGVFSHTGADSVYFNRFGRYPELGAYQSMDSAYRDWYDFEQWPDKYQCWWGFKELPDVNEEQSGYLDFITGDNGVLRLWQGLGAAGWRLDVADELPDLFLERLRQTVKEADPDAIVIGEVWEDASNKSSYGTRRHYLEGRQLDSVMNYPWRTAIIDYLKTGKAENLAESIMEILENYPKQTVDALMNLLGSHDTTRILTAFAGESAAGKSTAWKQNTRIEGQARETGLALLRLASTIQYFLPGVPCIYYGDEAGFEGYEDPFNRQCYQWGKEDAGLIKWFSSLGAVRAVCPAVKDGEFRLLAAENGLFSFARTKGTDSAVVAVNMGEETATVALEGALDRSLTLDFGGVSYENGLVSLPPKSCAVVRIGRWAEQRQD